MRTSIVASLVTLLMTVGVAGSAESGMSPIGVSVYGGMATPTGTLAEFSNSGFSLGGSISYQASDYIAYEFAGASGQKFGVDDNEFVEDASVNVFSMTGGLRMGKLEASAFPYAVVGAGYYRISSDLEITIPGVGTQSVGVSDNALGLNFGGGIQTQVNPLMSVFGEMRYHIAFTSGESTKFMPIHAGMRFSW
jgi:opacity protein-like surface antigen